ncbi:TRAP transporter, 4TM/12TM fusion protein [Meinhardsimonia xiamenensis]|jgi:TRAP transporter 4TM/12TM fusion protein|uniref:TRAP transporter, 4TM/12TM fusion protein n=1 Tax=Meinhardsimonia xiamenensis TaxID=990712 RepID=A0A1G9AY62_9RHOB|nr:TRAP transporter fused permease subunit [Meinhardsimonia xiamenensis]PRX35200.1 TRAP transporter 4TM/12TM fusion protein [Meinhardsimonia xiamenensis]SDK32261.1 TRAP transporter, 4TM/12TM fusion protein [Meinhardsimonia xiamenensis]
MSGAVRLEGLGRWLVAGCATTMVVACILWNVEAPTRLGFAILPQQYMALQLGLALAICYLAFDARGGRRRAPGTVALLVALGCLGVLGYAALDFQWLLKEQFYRPWQITLVGTVVVLAVMEGIRRRTGWMLFSIVAAFLLYALLADRVPGRLIGKAVSPKGLVDYVGFDSSAVFSSPLAVGTMVVLLFVFFGQLLFAAGGGAFFTDLAMAAAGRSRGGSAKIAVIGSALFGAISGSAVSNVATTGVITIPLMQRGGYRARDAGAIEAVASTGGQLAPPIMGAAAFLMAEFLDIPYASVAAAALLPAVLYFLAVFVQVDLIAGRDRIAAAEADQRGVAEVLAQGWHFAVPFALLLAGLFWWRMDPEDSALLAAVAIAGLGFLRGYGDKRLTLRSLGQVFVDTGTGMVDLILVVAAAGFVIGVLNITGLGFALTLVLVDAVGGNLLLLLAMSAAICIVLGMGMPTSGVYVLLAALVAPALVEAGIGQLAAHLFILYFGMMSMITPPVALAAFAAAAISRDDPLMTGLAAMRVGWAAFILPFVFVATPALLMEGGWGAILRDFALTAVGVAAVTAGIVGFWSRRLGLAARARLTALGALALPLGAVPLAASAAAALAAALWAVKLSISDARRAQDRPAAEPGAGAPATRGGKG